QGDRRHRRQRRVGRSGSIRRPGGRGRVQCVMWAAVPIDINMTPLWGAADILQPQMNPHSKMMTHLGTWFAAALVAWWPASIRAQDTRRAAESLPQAGPGDWPIP